ncbi:hypothetical protein ACFYWS_20385 [Streptomyces sp. NPDC002795]|uniref:hypothetical protein n=1 Tax=Streptomyces sp. NPDC002795 TaxID=3364665 RepID=UPI0036B69EB3
MADRTILLAVQVTADTGTYADADDLAAHVTGWIDTALDDRDGLRARTLTRLDPGDREPAQYATDEYGTPCYRHTDPDGDRLLVAASDIPQQGPGIYFRTTTAGVSIPLDQLGPFTARLPVIADVARTEHARNSSGQQ